MTIAKTRSARSALERRWSARDAADTYQVEAWGKGYFGINSEGHMVVRPERTAGEEIDLLEVVEGLRDRGLNAPLLLRFSNLLTQRLREMRDTFAEAMSENEYRGGYLAVYPIKVNQQRSVVEEVYRYGADYGFGLEVGSKPELLAVRARSVSWRTSMPRWCRWGRRTCASWTSAAASEAIFDYYVGELAGYTYLEPEESDGDPNP